ncbi:mitochondrial 5-aminolevulinate synthase [Rhizoclosmatium sp. JEL0117]|nr:mitochondrial 5-aminolevulinate synthase [Rhizoclosmatium sp. JEL0117]
MEHLVSGVTRACPFLARTPVSALRQMSTSVGVGCPHALSSEAMPSLSIAASVAAAATAAQLVSQGGSSAGQSQLFKAATECPVFGRALAVQSVRRVSAVHSHSQARHSHSHSHSRTLATNAPAATESGAGRDSTPIPRPLFESMPHAYSNASPSVVSPKKKAPEPATTPIVTDPSSSIPGGFQYDAFFKDLLEKKHKDKSYRYFNNINRLAQLYPMAHTGTGEHVTVWCSNDYLGMSKHPEVMETMK